MFAKKGTATAFEETEIDHSSKLSTACTIEDQAAAFPKVVRSEHAKKRKHHHAKSSKKHAKSRASTTKANQAVSN